MKRGALFLLLLLLTLIFVAPSALMGEDAENLSQSNEVGGADGVQDAESPQDTGGKTPNTNNDTQPGFVDDAGKIQWTGSTAPKSSSDAPTTSSGMGPVALDIFIWLSVLAIMIIGGLWAFKRFFPGSKHMFGSKLMRILGRSHLSSKHTVYLVKIADRVLVLGVSGDRINQLTEICDPREVAFLTAEGAGEPKNAGYGGFMSLLKREKNDISTMSAPPKEDKIAETKAELDRIKNMVSSWKEHYSDAENG